MKHNRKHRKKNIEKNSDEELEDSPNSETEEANLVVSNRLD